MSQLLVSVLCILALGTATPQDVEILPVARPTRPEGADAPHAAGAAPRFFGPHCRLETEILEAQSCRPTPRHVCRTETVDTEKVVYEQVCKDVTDLICPPHLRPPLPHHHRPPPLPRHRRPPPPPHHRRPPPPLHRRPRSPYVKRSAKFQFFPAAPRKVRPAAAGQIANTGRQQRRRQQQQQRRHTGCREVATRYCVDSPTVKVVAVPVEQCHKVTKMDCRRVEHPIPRVVCPERTGGVGPREVAGHTPSVIRAIFGLDPTDKESFL